MDGRIRKLLDVMDRELDRPIELADLASSVRLSPSRMRALFKREIGDTPSRYLRRQRLERARLLLFRSELSVKEVMTMVGLSDQSHFVRNFEQSFGLSPSRYRVASCNSDRADAPIGQ